MTRNPGASLNDQLFAQLERLSDVNLSGDALQGEIASANSLCLKTQIQIQIGQSMMLLQQIKGEAPRLLILNPDTEECFRDFSACLKALAHSLENLN